MAIEPVRLEATVTGNGGEDRPVPALLFVPRSDHPLPLVLLGHGAHLSKDDAIMQMLAAGSRGAFPPASRSWIVPDTASGVRPVPPTRNSNATSRAA